MNVLVDSSVWSLALRRPGPRGQSVEVLTRLIEEGRAVLVGAIRQEILSGIRDQAQFDLLREKLEPFEDLEVSRDDYVRAASFYNLCRSTGIQGSNTDFLICAAAYRHDAPIFTTDQDFHRFAGVLPIQLFA